MGSKKTKNGRHEQENDLTKLNTNRTFLKSGVTDVLIFSSKDQS